jgi:hypothetical protein
MPQDGQVQKTSIHHRKGPFGCTNRFLTNEYTKPPFIDTALKQDKILVEHHIQFIPTNDLITIYN